MIDKESLLEFLRKRASELKKELEIIEELIRIVETAYEFTEIEPHVVKERDSIRITLPRSLDPDSVEAEYLISRLNEITGEYELLRDKSGKVRGVKINKVSDDKVLREIKSLIKVIVENSAYQTQ